MSAYSNTVYWKKEGVILVITTGQGQEEGKIAFGNFKKLTVLK